MDWLTAILIGREHGMLWHSPFTLVGIALLPWLFRRSAEMTIWIGSGSLLLILFLLGYEPWVESYWGNRFVIPLVASE